SPFIKMPAFVSFIRTPFGVMFETYGHPGAARYTFKAINAHLYFGNYLDDRHHEIDALLDWILGRALEGDAAEALNIILLGDLNLDYDNPGKDRARIAAKIKGLNRKGGKDVNVYFPFLDAYPQRQGRQVELSQRLHQGEAGFLIVGKRMPFGRLAGAVDQPDRARFGDQIADGEDQAVVADHGAVPDPLGAQHLRGHRVIGNLGADGDDRRQRPVEVVGNIARPGLNAFWYFRHVLDCFDPR
ncbi:MAG: hypothetical protein CFH40_01400, partial [Alphaproteobacteria bacterium MarineAlpha10_Bin3]